MIGRTSKHHWAARSQWIPRLVDKLEEAIHNFAKLLGSSHRLKRKLKNSSFYYTNHFFLMNFCIKINCRNFEFIEYSFPFMMKEFTLKSSSTNIVHFIENRGKNVGLEISKEVIFEKRYLAYIIYSRGSSLNVM